MGVILESRGIVRIPRESSEISVKNASCMSAAAAGTPGSDLAQAEDYSSLEIISDSDSDD